MKKIAGIILAAGASRRFGAPKLLQRMPDGQTLLYYVVDITVKTKLNPIITILGQDWEKQKKEIEKFGVLWAINPDWNDGISSSLRKGIESLPAKCEACMVILADQPFISPELIDGLIDAYQKKRTDIVYPKIEGQRANPVILDRKTFTALSELRGDVGARKIFPDFKVHEYEWTDKRLLQDVDTKADLKAVYKLIDERGPDQNFNISGFH